LVQSRWGRDSPDLLRQAEHVCVAGAADDLAVSDSLHVSL
jgi:hypothetical protein